MSYARLFVSCSPSAVSVCAQLLRRLQWQPAMVQVLALHPTCWILRSCRTSSGQCTTATRLIKCNFEAVRLHAPSICTCAIERSEQTLPSCSWALHWLTRRYESWTACQSYVSHQHTYKMSLIMQPEALIMAASSVQVDPAGRSGACCCAGLAAAVVLPHMLTSIHMPIHYRMVNETDIVELELKSKRFSLSLKKKAALAEPVVQVRHTALPYRIASTA